MKLSDVRKTAERETAAAAKAAEQIESALDDARKDSAAASALASTLKQQLAERKAAAKESTCTRCGQPIDKKAAKQQIDELTTRARRRAATRDRCSRGREAGVGGARRGPQAA